MERAKSSDENRGTPRSLACQNCRKRRRKCDGQLPCSNCVKLNVECVRLNQDLRRNRSTTAYVKSLEQHIGKLEAALKNARDSTDNEEKNRYLDSISTLECVSGQHSHSPKLRDVSCQIPTDTSSSVETNSIYPSNSLSINKKKQTFAPVQALTNLRALSRSPPILLSLSLFFKWLYPGHYMFIHRETFLSAFFGDESTKSYYCSEELVFAIAALGSELSNRKEKLFNESERYYQTAKAMVLKTVFQLDDISLADSTSSSKLAIIQTLLCLAFFDIGRGENAMAWYLSGLAFRVAHEIGLHLNPKAWTNVYEDNLSKIDFEVRSRIYWGCYLADHLISTLFGRSTSLRMSNSTIPDTDELPDIETGIEDYMYDPSALLPTATPIKKLVVLSRITEVFASKIFTQTESLDQRSQYLLRFNVEASHWRNDLPPELVWTKESLQKSFEINPAIAYVWFHYYIILISYNKPFIGDMRESRTLIEEYVEELHCLFALWKSKFSDFEKCNIYMVYSAILAVQCIKTDMISKQYYSEFTSFLESPSLNYDLARKFVDTEVAPESLDLLGNLPHGREFSLEYNFDFTLLNEIDTLIESNGDITKEHESVTGCTQALPSVSRCVK